MVDINVLLGIALVVAGGYITYLHAKISQMDDVIITLLDEMGVFDDFKE